LQLDSLSMPMRLAIVQRLENDKTATAAELARRMGRPVTSLYHHLGHLEAVGLIHVVGERRGMRRPEAGYAMVADQFSSADAVKTPDGLKSYARTATRVAEAGARAFSAAAASGAARFDGDGRNAMLRFFVLRADHAKLALLNKLLGALEDALREQSSEGEEIMLTLLLSPQQVKS
jgi:predicted ArsR family transcriptional regulator